MRCFMCDNEGFEEAELVMRWCRDCAAKEGLLDEQKVVDPPNQKQSSGYAKIRQIMLTTETTPNLVIERRLAIVSADCAFGMNIFKDVMASVRDIVGGRSQVIQDTLRESRRVALDELKREAYLLGGNAVVGVSLSYVQLSGTGSMILLVASGTAVVIAG